jgi:hypothetical protein
VGARIFAVTVISVSLILMISGLPQAGQTFLTMLGGSNFSFGFDPQFEQA